MALVIIDDCPLNLAILKRLASERGARDVVAFSDPLLALDHLQTASAQVIILDHGMEEMDGLELIRRLRSSPRHFATPIVMVTGAEDPIVRKLAGLAGVTDFLEKPLDVAQFKGVLSRLVAVGETSEPSPVAAVS